MATELPLFAYANEPDDWKTRPEFQSNNVINFETKYLVHKKKFFLKKTVRNSRHMSFTLRKSVRPQEVHFVFVC